MKNQLYLQVFKGTKKVAFGLTFLLLCNLPFWAVASEEAFIGTIKSSQEKYDSTSIEQLRPVLEYKVRAKEEYQGGQFWVLGRKTSIERFNCAGCHNDKPVQVKQGLELTHGDIKVMHGRSGDTLSCLDCHSGEDLSYLEDKEGKKIDFDHSYQLCGQCHFRQKRDWLGGAHGKRVAYWAGERVIYNCASCHNPHSPLFPSRFPATYAVPLN